MKIELIYLGRRGAGGPISLELARNLSSLAPTQAVINSFVENIDLWRRLHLDFFDVRTYSGIGSALKGLFFQRPIKDLARRISAQQPDVLLFPMFHPWNFILQDLLFSIPSIVIVHDQIPHPGLRDFIYAYFESRSLLRADRIISLSSSQISALVRRGVNPQKIEMVHHGIFTYYQEFYPTISPSRTPTEPRILFFGRITPYKGLDVLLRAFKNVHTQFPQARLTIAGEGDLRPYTRLLRETPNIEIVNRWIGEAEVSDFFQNASIVVLPYTNASQSGVIPIAAAFALPVIATRVGALSEQLEHDRTGLLIPPESPKKLAEAILRLIAEPDTARRLGKNLQITYQDERNWRVITRQVYDICEKVYRGEEWKMLK